MKQMLLNVIIEMLLNSKQKTEKLKNENQKCRNMENQSTKRRNSSFTKRIGRECRVI